MQTDVAKKLFTVDEYYRMAEVGILAPDDRVELIEGEIIQMSPIGVKHASDVDRATAVFYSKLGKRVIARVQGPVRLDDYSEPQPDISLLKPREDFYRSRQPAPEDVLLEVEVSDTTIRYDSGRKLGVYAKAGIQEYWIEDLNRDVLLVFRDPEGRRYKTQLTLARGESISPLAFPDVVFAVEELLG
jgi:Uma2 family endonuclease